ncbi:microtubule associated protein [Histomonas meleagridis]|uniref:microtubule associated protein n=1 Tax=Histomonas meleagridis TaxID=135588 RepID=UPI0035595E66|nr:microtubule associated protein [Histomonas meleagridis]KAH0796387.1 microtubule associated protein [Histomonas meleagridis]
MKIDVNIEEQVEELWKQIGLSNEEIEQEYQNINEQVRILFGEILQHYTDQYNSIKKETEETESAIQLHIKRFDMDEIYEQIDPSQTLRARLKNAKKQLKSLQSETSEQEKEFRESYESLEKCFNILEVKDRGEFSTEGDDFSYERIDRMESLLADLQSDISERRPQVEDLIKEINSFQTRLGINKTPIPATLGDSTIRSLETERDNLDYLCHTNEQKVKDLLHEITRIESVIRRSPPVSPDTKNVSDSRIASLNEKLENLQKEKDKMLPEFIEASKKQLLRLWGELHIPVPTVSDFPFIYTTQNNKRTLIALESEVRRLENIKESSAPMIALIMEREEILTKQKKLNETASDPNRLTSRRANAASALMEEERLRKKITVDLPKIHEKLIPMLMEYEDTFGEPFLWDGENLLEIVKEQRKKEEAELLKSKVKNVKQRTSSRTRTMKLSQRAPFQLQEYLF